MTRYGVRICLLLILFSLYLFIPPRYHAAFWQQLLPKRPGETADGSPTRPVQTFIARQGDWLEFDIPAGAESLRLLTNASLTRPVPQLDPRDPRYGWKYALQYQVVDRSGAVLTESVYHFRTRLISYREPEDGEPEEGAPFHTLRFAQADLQPAATREMRLNLLGFGTQGLRFRLRADDQDAAIQDVATRVYYRLSRRGWRPYWWARLSPRERARIARGALYPPGMLTLQEQRHLFRYVWSAAAPNGIEGRDFQRRLLQVLEFFEGEEILPESIPAGTPVTPHLNATLVLPADAAAVELHLQRFQLPDGRMAPDAGGADAGGADAGIADAGIADAGGGNPPVVERRGPHRPRGEVVVTARWYGATNRDRAEFTTRFTGKTHHWKLPLGNGLLELQSNAAIVVKGTVCEPAERRRALAQEPLISLMYPLGQGITCPITHLDDKPTPLRIQVRRVLSAASRAAVPEVRWQLRNSAGALVRSGTLPFDQPVSQLDYVDGTYALEAVSEAQAWYLDVPPQACSLHLSSSSPQLYAAVATRPPDLPTATHVPADYRPAEGPRRQRRWFPVRPAEDLVLRRGNATLVVNCQPRPPEDDPLIQAGAYQFSQFEPLGPWRGRQLLAPAAAHEFTRREAAESRYLELQCARDHQVVVHAETLHAAPRLSVIYDRADLPPTEVAVLVDGRLLDRRTLVQRRGEWQLPPLQGKGLTRRHRLQLRSQSLVRFFVNRVSVSPSHPECPPYQKRSVKRFAEEPLTFAYDRASAMEEVLSLTVYRTPDSRGELLVAVELVPDREGVEDPNPGARVSLGDHLEFVDSWTPPQRVFHVAPRHEFPALLLGTPNGQLDAGQTCYLPIGTDIPAGSYRIVVSQRNLDASREACYLALTRLLPGEFPHREVFWEHHFAPNASPTDLP